MKHSYTMEHMSSIVENATSHPQSHHLHRARYNGDGTEYCEMAQTWLDLANGARRAAHWLITDHSRSCVARAYYAAYSKVTHELVMTAGLPVPPGREGFGHRRTRTVVETSMPNMSDTKRRKLSELLGRLYTLRIDADYKPSTIVEDREAREAISIMKTIFESF